MPHCINTSSSEYKKLAKEAGINQNILKAKIGVWQEKNKTDEFPTVKELGLISDNPYQYKQHLLKKFNANESGYIRRDSYPKLINDIRNYNIEKGYQAIILKEKNNTIQKAINFDYYLTVNNVKATLTDLNDIAIEKNYFNTRPRVENTESINRAATDLGFDIKLKEDHSKVNFILGKILNSKDTTPQTKFLANWLKKIPNDFKNVKVELVEGLRASEKQEARILLDSNIIQLDSKLGKDTLVKAFLHELLHNITNQVIDNPKNAEQKRLVKQINDIRSKAKKYYEQEYGIDLTTENLKKLAVTDKAKFRELRKLYGLVDNHEFLSELFTNADFQLMLATTPFDKDQSLFEKLIEAIKDIIKSITALNFTNTDSKFLQQALGDSIKLVDSITDSSIQEVYDYNTVLGSLETVVKDQQNLIGEYLTKLVKRRDKVEETLRKEKTNTKKKKELENVLSDLQKQITDIKTNYDYLSVLRTANSNMNYINDLLGKTDLTDSDIIEIQNFISLYKNVTKYLPEDYKYDDKNPNEFSSLYNAFADIEKKAKDFDRKVFKLEANYLIKLNKELFGNDVTEEDLFKIGKDIYGKEFLSAGRFGVKLLEIVETLNKLANNRATETKEKLESENKELFKKVKENALYKEKGDDLFLQFENGKWTGNRITKFTKDYYKEFGKHFYDKHIGIVNLLKNKNKTSEDKKNIKKFFSWYKENHFVIDYTKFSDNNKIDKDYAKQIKEEFGDTYGKYLIDQAEQKLEMFKMDESVYIDSLKDYDSEKAASYLHYWQVNNSPLLFNKTINGDIQLHEGKYPNSYNFKYITSTAIDKWHDSNYKELEKAENKELLDYLEYTDNIMSKIISLLPDKELSNKKLSKNFLPIVAKNVIDKYAHEGTLSGLASASGDWIKNFVTHSKESQTTENDEYTGRPDFQLNIKGLNPITKFNVEKGDYEIDRDAQSKDLFQLMNYAISNLAIYQHKSDIEDSYKMVNRAFNRIGVEEYGHNVNQNDLKNIKSLNEFMEKVYYGKESQIEGELNRKAYDKDEKLLKKEIEERKSEIEPEIELLSNKEDITEEEKATLDSLAYEKSKLDKAESELGTNFSLGKTGRSLLKYVQLKTMGLNVFSGINEVVFGLISTLNFSVGGSVFNQKDWYFAFKQMLNRRPLNDKDKIAKLLTKFRIKENSVLENSDPTNKVTNKLYLLQAGAEAFSRGITMMAYLNSIKVETTDGTKTLYDVLDDEGNIDLKDLTKEEKDKWSKKTEGLDLSEIEKVNLALQELMNKIHGNYDPDSKILGKSTFIGLAALQFRSWIPEGVANRFQQELYNSRLGIKTKGSYRTLAESDNFYNMLKYMATGLNTKYLDGMSDVDKSNTRKNALELTMILTVMGALVLLIKYNDDDKDDSNIALNLFINTLLRVQSDLAFYADPNEVEKLNSKLIPATQLWDDIQDIRKAAYDVVLGEPTIKSGVYAGHNKFFKEMGQSTPVINQGYKMIFQAMETLDKIHN